MDILYAGNLTARSHASSGSTERWFHHLGGRKECADTTCGTVKLTQAENGLSTAHIRRCTVHTL